MSHPQVTCVVDVSVRRDGGGGWVQLRSHQVLTGGLVVAVTSDGARAEVDCWPVDAWAARLARLAAVPVPPAPGPPDAEVEVPFDVLLGAGEALRTRRPDLLDELVRRAAPPDPVALREQLVRLHAAVVGRLLAVVAARDEAGVRAGWVSWLLFGDGWRSLAPLRVGGHPVVRITPALPGDLGRQIAAQVALVRRPA